MQTPRSPGRRPDAPAGRLSLGALCPDPTDVPAPAVPRPVPPLDVGAILHTPFRWRPEDEVGHRHPGLVLRRQHLPGGQVRLWIAAFTHARPRGEDPLRLELGVEEKRTLLGTVPHFRPSFLCLRLLNAFLLPDPLLPDPAPRRRIPPAWLARIQALLAAHAGAPAACLHRSARDADRLETARLGEILALSPGGPGQDTPSPRPS